MVRLMIIVISLFHFLYVSAQKVTAFNAPDTGIQFVLAPGWQQVLQKAKEENKFIFVDCYTTWCKPCKEMEKKVYPLEKVGDFFNEKFVSVKVQMDTARNDGDAVKKWYADASYIMEKYGVTAFPTYLFFTPDGRILRKNTGAKTAEEFIAMAAETIDPDKQYYVLLEKFRKNRNTGLDDMIFLTRTALLLGDSAQANEIAQQYFLRSTEKDWLSNNHIQFIADYTKRSSDKGFRFFYNNTDKINDIMGDDTYAQLLVQRVISDELVKPALKKARQSKIQPDWDAISSRIVKKYNAYYAERLIIASRPGWALENNNNREYAKYLTLYMEKYGSKTNTGLVPSLILNNYAWEIFQFSDDTTELSKALNWSSHAVMMYPAPNWMDTYANILYKLGRKEEAIMWEEIAVKLDPKNEEFNSNLEKMKKQLPTWNALP